MRASFAALLALVLDDVTGWRGLFWIGALPLVLLVPLALVRLPESPKWLVSRGRIDDAARADGRAFCSAWFSWMAPLPMEGMRV